MAATESEVAAAFKRAGQYRIQRAYELAGVGAPDGISGSLILALGLRETGLRNIEGGAKWDPVRNRWVGLGPEDAHIMDVGALQIARRWNPAVLKALPAVKVGTWAPVVPGKTPYDLGYAPRWTDSLRVAIRELQEGADFARDNGITGDDAIRFAVAAYNAGQGGALSGYRAGNVDKYTAMGDYSAWVLATRTVVNHWLGKHPNWITG